MILKVSFGRYDAHDRWANAEVTKEWSGEWPELMKLLQEGVLETTDKAARGWVCGATFTKPHRHKDYFDKRYLINLDYDHVTPEDVTRVLAAYEKYASLAYTTWSHTSNNPRVRVWMPLDRPVNADEYRAISRAVADKAGIELVDTASFAPAQYMYLPTHRPNGEFWTWNSNGAPPISADGVLNEYVDWTDRKAWPRKKDEPELGAGERAQDPREKPGIVGEFCRKFSIPEAIEAFDLPYTHIGGDRWTYIHGSRPEGAIVYDDDAVLHSHHDTDPARGQHNSFDLVRLHRFGNLDVGGDAQSLAERPSQKAMFAFARECCPIGESIVEYGPLEDDQAAQPEVPAQPGPPKLRRFQPIPIGEFATGAPLEWTIDKILPKAEFALCYGPPGAGKTAIALSLAIAVASGQPWFDKYRATQGRVLYIAAEDSEGVKARCRAWAELTKTEIDTLNEHFLVIENAPDLSSREDLVELMVEIKLLGQFSLIVLDTWSRIHSKDENSAADMNPVINACQAIYKQCGALVLGVHHVGKDASRGSRGSSALNGATNVEMEVIRNEDGSRRVACRKMKNGRDDWFEFFKLDANKESVIAVPAPQPLIVQKVEQDALDD